MRTICLYFTTGLKPQMPLSRTFCFNKSKLLESHSCLRKEDSLNNNIYFSRCSSRSKMFNIEVKYHGEFPCGPTSPHWEGTKPYQGTVRMETYVHRQAQQPTYPLVSLSKHNIVNSLVSCLTLNSSYLAFRASLITAVTTFVNNLLVGPFHSVRVPRV